MNISSVLTNFHLENYQFYKIDQKNNSFVFTRLNHQDFLIQHQLTSLITEGLLALHSTVDNRVYLNKNIVKKIDESSSASLPKISQVKNSLNVSLPVNDEVEFCEITDELQLNLKLAISVIDPEITSIPIPEENESPKPALPKQFLPPHYFYKSSFSKGTLSEEFILRKSVSPHSSPYKRESEKDEIANQKKRNKEYEERLAEEKQGHLKEMLLRYGLKKESLKKY